MAMQKPTPPKTTTTVKRTVTVTFDQDYIREVLREKCGAPAEAMVEIESYGDATVTWSTIDSAV